MSEVEDRVVPGEPSEKHWDIHSIVNHIAQLEKDKEMLEERATRAEEERDAAIAEKEEWIKKYENCQKVMKDVEQTREKELQRRLKQRNDSKISTFLAELRESMEYSHFDGIEKASMELQTATRELKSELKKMRDKCEVLEIENISLRGVNEELIERDKTLQSLYHDLMSGNGATRELSEYSEDEYRQFVEQARQKRALAAGAAQQPISSYCSRSDSNEPYGNYEGVSEEPDASTTAKRRRMIPQ